jgi:hypothetical protein
MAKTIVLDIEEDYSFDIVGVSCPLKDYRFIFFLNKALGFHFERKNLLEFNYKNVKSEHSVYYYYDKLNESEFICVSNKSKNSLISPEYKHMDFLILVNSENGDDYLKDIVKQIRSQKQIIMASLLDSEKIKAYKNLCYEVELQLNTN